MRPCTIPFRLEGMMEVLVLYAMNEEPDVLVCAFLLNYEVDFYNWWRCPETRPFKFIPK